MTLNLVLLCICSLFGWDNSVKSNEKLFGDDCGFFFRIGTSSAEYQLQQAYCHLLHSSNLPHSLWSQSDWWRIWWKVVWCWPCRSWPQLAHSIKGIFALLLPWCFPHRTPAPVWLSQSFASRNCCSRWFILTCISQSCLSDLIPLSLMIWLISFAMPIFCHAILFVASKPSVVVALFCQPVYDHCHQVDFGCCTICLPWYPAVDIFMIIV